MVYELTCNLMPCLVGIACMLVKRINSRCGVSHFQQKKIRVLRKSSDLEIFCKISFRKKSTKIHSLIIKTFSM